MKKSFLITVLFLFVFDLNAKVIYVDPVQNAEYVNTENSIIIGFDEVIRSSDFSSLITVIGTKSGNHTGEIILVENRKKLLFKPHQPFAFNETVEVKLNNLKTGNNSNNKLNYSFQTEDIKREISQFNKTLIDPEYSFNNSSLVYSDNFPVLPVPQPLVTISNNPSLGRVLICNVRSTNYPSTLMITNNDGSLFYAEDIGVGVDFKRQPNGSLTHYGLSKYYELDSLYNRVDSFYCGNGYSTDGHELRILNNEHALVMCYDSQFVNMSLIVPGGNPNAIVIGLIIQEIDKNKNVVFQWRSWDHIPITDAVDVNLTAAVVDYIHGNAIEQDNDGNILISSRHLNEITKINRATGAMIWRFGGRNNQFTFVNDTIPFHYQHDIRRIANGNITMFDNGNFRTPLVSRALEYSLDEVNKVATLVWQYKHTPVVYGAFMGSVQRLRNGNTLIGWGGTSPALTEVTPSGQIALEMTLPAGVFSYRVFRDEVHFTVNVKLAIEGMYNTVTDKMNMKDTVTVFLRNAASPYTVVDSMKSEVDSVVLKGNYGFYNAASGTYYISVKHRNGLETWSKAGGETFVNGGTYLYDFTNSASKAYGNNTVLKGSKYCIISGDVNQDKTIDAGDLSSIENDASSSLSGYVDTDLNGDNAVDAADISIVESNVVNGKIVIMP